MCFVLIILLMFLQVIYCDDQYSKNLPKPKHPIDFCTNNYHIHGKWVFNNSSNLQKSFLCCSWDNHDYEWNATECSKPAAQDSDFYVGLSGSQASLVGGHACNCDIIEGRTTVNKRERYFWQPDYCQLSYFDAVEFCALLGPNKLLFVGDSTLNQNAVTLMSAIRSGGGNCSFNIIFGRNSELINPLATHYRMDWLEFVHYTQARIVIIGFGAHFHTIDSYVSAWETIGEMYLRDEKVLRDRNVTILFKTSNPGHLNCTGIDAPVHTRKYINKDDPRDYYQWGMFPMFDHIGKVRARMYGMKVLDLYPLYLRPDGHPPGDCLHFCMPGPLNVLNDILFTMLRSKEIELP